MPGGSVDCEVDDEVVDATVVGLATSEELVGSVLDTVAMLVVLVATGVGSVASAVSCRAFCVTP